MQYQNKPSRGSKKVTIGAKVFRLFYLFCLTGAVGYISSTVITPESLAWYNSLILSDYTPSAKWFGIAWTILYALMAISAFLVWNRASPRPFVLQLALNLIWPFVFFYLKEPTMALIVILMMLFFVVWTIYAFGRVSVGAALLLVPLLIWSCFATYLNLIVVLYNTQLGVWLGLI